MSVTDLTSPTISVSNEACTKLLASFATELAALALAEMQRGPR